MAMNENPEADDELRRVAAILEAWAENIRADATGNDAQRMERNAAMAHVMATAAAALRAAPSDNRLAAAICAANAIRADGVPQGFDLAQVYTDGSEIVVCGLPAPDDETHDCEEMGCGAYAHVIYRTTCNHGDEPEKEGPFEPEQAAEPEGGAIDGPGNSTD